MRNKPEQMQITLKASRLLRSEKIDAMADSTSNDGAVGVKPPDEMHPIQREDKDATSAELSDMPPIGAKPPDYHSASELPELQLGASPPPSAANTPIQQEMISRKKKQRPRAFLDMCRLRAGDLPYYAFQKHIETLSACVSQWIRHLALIGKDARTDSCRCRTRNSSRLPS